MIKQFTLPLYLVTRLTNRMEDSAIDGLARSDLQRGEFQFVECEIGNVLLLANEG